MDRAEFSSFNLIFRSTTAVHMDRQEETMSYPGCNYSCHISDVRPTSIRHLQGLHRYYSQNDPRQELSLLYGNEYL